MVKGWIIEGQATEYNDEYTYALDAYERHSAVFLDKEEAEAALAEEKKKVAREVMADATSHSLGYRADQDGSDYSGLISAFGFDEDLEGSDLDDAMQQFIDDNPDVELTLEQTDAVLALFANIRLTEIEIIPSKKESRPRRA